MNENDDARDHAWSVVRTLPGLRAEPKAAWLFLWRRARRRPDTVEVAYSELATDQGKSDRSARRWVERLAEFHLVDVLEREPNRVKLYIWEPREVCRARGEPESAKRPLLERPAPAGEPGPAATHGGSAAEPPQVPTLGNDKARATPLSLSEITFGLTKTESSARAGAAAAEPPRERHDQAAPIGAAIATTLHRLFDRDDASDLVKIHRLSFALMQRYPGLRETPARRVAAAVVRNQLPRRAFDELLAWVDGVLRKDASTPPYQPFTGGAARVFARHHLEWPAAAAAKPR